MINVDVISLRNSGIIPVANLNLFDSIENFNFSNAVLDHENFLLAVYKDYISYLKNIPLEERNTFLQFLKKAEVIDTRCLESEDNFLTAFSSEIDSMNAIDYLLNCSKMSERDFIEAHKLLLRGTKSDRYADKNYRTDDRAFVYDSLSDGTCYITYFSLPCAEIEKAIGRIVEFYHSDFYDEHIFLKSQIIHGIVAALQMFDDGNTRYARILQNIKLFELTCKNLDDSIASPVLYGTRSYFPFRSEYRKLICDLVVDPSFDHWNKWFEFNLNRCEYQISFWNDYLIEENKKFVK